MSDQNAAPHVPRGPNGVPLDASTRARMPVSPGRSGAPSRDRRAGGPRAPSRRPAHPTSWSSSSTTSASPTSAATAPRSPPRTSTRSPRAACASPTSTPRRCARPPGPRCSPGSTRTAAGIGTVAHVDPGFPGYAMELAPRRRHHRRDAAATRATPRCMVGKWHLTKDSDQSDAGTASLVAVPAGLRPLLRVPRRLHQPPPPAPARRGQPRRRRRPVPRRLLLHRRPHRPRHLDDPRAQGVQPDQAVLPVLRARRGARAAARQGRGHRASTAAATTPAGTPCASSATRRQQELGVIAAGTPSWRPATPSPTTTSRPWDELDATASGAVRPAHGGVRGHGRQHRPEPRPAARRARRAGRARQHDLHLHLRQRRVPRGRGRRAPAPTTCTCSQGDDLDADLARIDLIGGPQTTPHYPRGWAMAGNTPFRLYKINTHPGGHSVPFIVSWPAGASARRRRAGAARPVRARHRPAAHAARPRRRRAPRPSATGTRSRPLAGRASTPVLADPDAPSAHTEQVFEMTATAATTATAGRW